MERAGVKLGKIAGEETGGMMALCNSQEATFTGISLLFLFFFYLNEQERRKKEKERRMGRWQKREKNTFERSNAGLLQKSDDSDPRPLFRHCLSRDRDIIRSRDAWSERESVRNASSF
jgi:hypothetical protein